MINQAAPAKPVEFPALPDFLSQVGAGYIGGRVMGINGDRA